MAGLPNIHLFPSFNADKDAEELRQAMKGPEVDGKKIVNVLANKSVSQRKEIAARYSCLCGKKLDDDLKSKLTGNFRDVVLASLQDVPEMKASALRKAMKGLGTDEDVLIQVISVAPNDEIQQIKQAFKDIFGRDLEKDVASETSGDFRIILVKMLKAQRDEGTHINHHNVELDADSLYKSGEGRSGNEEAKFTEVLGSRSFPHIKETAKVYADRYKKTLTEAINGKTSGNYRDTLNAIVANAENPVELQAKWIHDSMAGSRTHDDDLTRLILSRAETDLGDIKSAYQRMTKKPLVDDIKCHTFGNYRDMLAAIVDDFKMISVYLFNNVPNVVFFTCIPPTWKPGGSPVTILFGQCGTAESRSEPQQVFPHGGADVRLVDPCRLDVVTTNTKQVGSYFP
ncbi:hypothetical protein Aperf_G00000097499 [Anoplocephala perfoliata]